MKSINVGKVKLWLLPWRVGQESLLAEDLPKSQVDWGKVEG